MIVILMMIVIFEKLKQICDWWWRSTDRIAAGEAAGGVRLWEGTVVAE